MISSAHILEDLWACSLTENLEKNAICFDISLHTILGLPDQFLRMLYMWPHSGPFLTSDSDSDSDYLFNINMYKSHNINKSNRL